MAPALVAAFGGKETLLTSTHVLPVCASALLMCQSGSGRPEETGRSGRSGCWFGVQAIFGTKSDNLKTEMDE